MKNLMDVTLDLRLFDGADGGGGGTVAAGSVGAPGPQGNAAPTAQQPEGAKPPAPPARAPKNPLATVKYGKQGEVEAQPDTKPAQVEGAQATAPEGVATPEARQAEFEKLIKGEYKDAFAARTQQIIDERFKQAKGLETRMTTLTPMLSMLSQKYGVPADDVEKLAAAIEEDSSFYEQEALEKGISVEQLKAYKKMERENAEFKRMSEERQRQENANAIYARWAQESEAVKGVYTGFDLAKECQHPQTGRDFLSLLKAGVPVRTAYEVVHKDDILGGAMQYTAQQVQKKTMDDIRARGMRPQENGAGGQAAAEVKTDVSKLTKADRDEIARRVARGEKIMF